jgi:hypothetical protein
MLASTLALSHDSKSDASSDLLPGSVRACGRDDRQPLLAPNSNRRRRQRSARIAAAPDRDRAPPPDAGPPDPSEQPTTTVATLANCEQPGALRRANALLPLETLPSRPQHTITPTTVGAPDTSQCHQKSASATKNQRGSANANRLMTTGSDRPQPAGGRCGGRRQGRDSPSAMRSQALKARPCVLVTIQVVAVQCRSSGGTRR